MPIVQTMSHADRPARDVAFLHSPTEDGKGVRIVRAREGGIQIGEVRALEEGQPIQGEVVTLTPREGSPRLCDVDVQYAPPPRSGGPAQVASASYRANWGAIFDSGDDDAPSSRPSALN